MEQAVGVCPERVKYTLSRVESLVLHRLHSAIKDTRAAGGTTLHGPDTGDP